MLENNRPNDAHGRSSSRAILLILDSDATPEECHTILILIVNSTLLT